MSKEKGIQSERDEESRFMSLSALMMAFPSQSSVAGVLERNVALKKLRGNINVYFNHDVHTNRNHAFHFKSL